MFKKAMMTMLQKCKLTLMEQNAFTEYKIEP